MTNLDAITDTLRQHQKRQGIRDLKTHCICSWVSTGANGPGEHLRHQAAQILATLTGAGATMQTVAQALREEANNIGMNDQITADFLNAQADALWPQLT